MSWVTCHVSHVTCYVSHVMCHMSHVTCIFFNEASLWSVCYQLSLPRLYFLKKDEKSDLMSIINNYNFYDTQTDIATL